MKDLTRFSRQNTRRKTKAPNRPLSQHTVAMMEYRKRYSITQYTLMLDVKLKERFQDFCVRNNLSPSGVIAGLITDLMDENEKKSA